MIHYSRMFLIANHCEGLTSSSCSICKYCRIISVKDRLNQWQSRFFKDFSLRCIWIEKHIKLELLLLIPVAQTTLHYIILINITHISKHDHIIIHGFNNYFFSLFTFFLLHWSHSDCNLDIFFFRFFISDIILAYNTGAEIFDI